jgi:NADH-quinone oxidoreductase subunit N
MSALGGESLRLGEFGWAQIIAPIALLSIVFGNMVALTQQDPKRMLAWSGVAHTGYLLLALAAVGLTGSPAPLGAIVFYALAYVLATGGAFGALSFLARTGGVPARWSDLDGLGHRHPWLAACLSVFLLSSAGVPLTAGFIGKFLVFGSAISAAGPTASDGGIGLFLLIASVLGIAASVAGAWYYLRGVLHMYAREATPDTPEPQVTAGAKAVLVLAALATLYLGVFPGSAFEMAGLAALLVP